MDATRGRQPLREWVNPLPQGQVDLEEQPGMADGSPQDPGPRRPEAGDDPSLERGDDEE